MKSRNDKRHSVRDVLLLLLMYTGLPWPMMAQVHTEMDAGIVTEVQGTVMIETEGNWLGQGILSPGQSTLFLHGPFTQLVQQDGGAFYNVTIDKSNGDVLLAGNIELHAGMLSIVHQDLVLNGFVITLDPMATLSEAPGNTVKGNAGYITTTRGISAPANENVGGMGLVIWSADNFGITEIRRGHAAQTANGVTGILRYFDVFPGFNEGLTATLTFHYDESELNGNSETDLKMYRSPDGGVNWMEVDGVLDTAGNTFEATGVNTFARFTLSSYCLETCIATVALTHPTNVYLNSAGLAYLLPENVDDGSRGACGIDSLKVFPDVFDCNDVGPQEVVFTVKDVNGCSKTSNVIVNVVDIIAPVAQCRNITILMDESCQHTITPGDLDEGSSDACGANLTINTSSFDCGDVGQNEVVLTATDPSGNTAQCTATITVELAPPDVVCQETTIDLGSLISIDISPFDLIAGDPGDYAGFTFAVDPATLSCHDLGEQIITLTATNPLGEVTECEAVLHLVGPDADCDEVADQCDLCDGGDDQQDTDGDGIPDCADWDGWSNLVEEWQCAANKAFVCHNGNVICINQNAVQDHLNHGDFLGACNATYCDDLPAQNTGLFLVHAPDAGAELPKPLAASDRMDHLADAPGHILAENIPNPFNAETMVRFYLPKEEWVDVSVFDMIGQPVGQLVVGITSEGWHEVIFDGSEQPEGIYFYRVQTHQESVTKPMVLISK